MTPSSDSHSEEEQQIHDANHSSTTSDRPNPSEPSEKPPQEHTESPPKKPSSPAAGEQPPLPDEEPPPLPDEKPPDDGWEPVWDANSQSFYFYNRFTQATQWSNPRIPQEASSAAGLGTHNRIPGAGSERAPGTSEPKVAGGYNPAIHGDYDPNADYAQELQPSDDEAAPQANLDPTAAYAAEGSFNRFTGRWQASTLTPENFNDENKSKRQMNAFFDVDAAANSHDGRSLKAERQGKKLSKREIKDFKQKRREKKEEKRRAWLRD